jgi:ChaB
MPKSSRYSITELPGTLQRSCREAQEAFLSALDDAVRIHGAGDQAHRVAYMALKQKFEKRGDHWIAKDNSADCGGGGGGARKLISLLPAGRAAAKQIQRLES